LTFRPIAPHGQAGRNLLPSEAHATIVADTLNLRHRHADVAAMLSSTKDGRRRYDERRRQGRLNDLTYRD
jgi:hypothetical protein